MSTTPVPVFIKRTDVSKPQDSDLDFCNRSEIWQACRQQRDACQFQSNTIFIISTRSFGKTSVGLVNRSPDDQHRSCYFIDKRCPYKGAVCPSLSPCIKINIMLFILLLLSYQLRVIFLILFQPLITIEKMQPYLEQTFCVITLLLQ